MNSVKKIALLFLLPIIAFSMSSCLILGGGDASCTYVFTNKSNPNDKIYACLDASYDDPCPDLKQSNAVKVDYEVSEGIMKQKLCDIDIEYPAKCNASIPETIYMSSSNDCLKVF